MNVKRNNLMKIIADLDTRLRQSHNEEADLNVELENMKTIKMLFLILLNSMKF